MGINVAPTEDKGVPYTGKGPGNSEQSPLARTEALLGICGVVILVATLAGYYGTILADGGISGQADSRPGLGAVVGFLVGVIIGLSILGVALGVRRQR